MSAVVGAVVAHEKSDQFDWGSVQKFFRTASVALAVITVVAHAWISDDALITLRSVTNALVGNGPAFNAAEMVQSYTHPLWFLLLVGLNSAVLAPVHWAVFLGVVLSIGTILLLVRAAGHDAMLAGALVLTVASLPAFVEWATGGLENSLAMFLVAALALATLRTSGSTRPILTGLLLAALVLTRFDLALIGMPLVTAWAWSRRPREIVLAGFAASIPVASWIVWARSTYGFILPNTFYAKLNVEIPTAELLLQGISYLRLSLARHPLLTMLLVLAFVVLARRRGALGLASKAAVLGAISLYLVYVVRIGGDFMEGRFFGVVVVLALVGVAVDVRPQSAESVPARGSGARELSGVLIAAVLVALIARSPVPWQSEGLDGERWAIGASGYGLIADERGFYVNMGQSFWTSQETRRMDEAFRSFSRVDGLPVDVMVTCGGLGRAGMEAGPSVHIVDRCALTDPVLARIPYRERAFDWRVGHYPRPIPEGYLAAIGAADPSLIEDPSIRALAEELWRVVR